MRKGRRRGVWFPNLGTSGEEGFADDDDNGTYAELIPPTTGESGSLIQALTFDHFVDEGAQELGVDARSLADFQGSEYILRRIVGKLFLAHDQAAPSAATPLGTQVTACFFVAREDEQPQLGFPVPIGATSVTNEVAKYGPSNVGNIHQPYIWRRQWILGNPSQTIQAGVTKFPPTNCNYGSVLDGPHIDAKTVRRVRREDRLWFGLQFRYLGASWDRPFNVDVPIALHVKMHLDYRLFGTLVKAKSSGTF